MITTAINGLGNAAPMPGKQAQTIPQQAVSEVGVREARPVRPEGDKVTVSTNAMARAVQAPVLPVEPVPLEEISGQIQEAVQEVMNRATSVKFTVGNESGDVVVSVVNRDSGDLIRQIPPEEIIHLYDTLRELESVLFNETF